MIRMSVLRNYPVVCNSMQIGLVQNVVLNEACNDIHALIVSRGIRGKVTVLKTDILAIADGFILANGIRKYKKADEKQVCPFVRDCTGTLIGRVTDYAIDEEKRSILAVEIILGYFPPENRSRIWMYDYNCSNELQKTVVVPAIRFVEPILFEEEE